MKLPLPQSYAPMEAKSVDAIPTGDQWQYEPKWDGFRCLAFRDGAEVELRSKSGQPLTRYFPELVEALNGLPAKKFVLDGEIVVPVGKALSFDDLLVRIHPAESRVRKLAAETPASMIVFDLLVLTTKARRSSRSRWRSGEPPSSRSRQGISTAPKQLNSRRRHVTSPSRAVG